MYKGKSIAQINTQKYQKVLQKLRQKQIDLSNRPDPYQLIRDEQKRDKQKGKKTTGPYNWVQSSIQINNDQSISNFNQNNSNSFAPGDISRQSNRNNTNTIAREDVSRHFQDQFLRNVEQNKNKNHQRPISFDFFDDDDNANNMARNNNKKIKVPSSSSSLNFNNQQFIEDIFGDNQQQKPQQKPYKQSNFQNSNFLNNPGPKIQNRIQNNFQHNQNQEYVCLTQQNFRQQGGGKKLHTKARDIFKNESKVEQFQKTHFKQNIEEKCKLVQCDPLCKLVTMKILQSTGPMVTNYKTGDIQMWQINRTYPESDLFGALRYFPHIKQFKNNQKAIIKCALNQNDVFTCIPTGGGKSLIFQIMTYIKKGIYLCILPLVSLIYDQQMQAQIYNIQAYSLTGATDGGKVKEIYNRISDYRAGQNSILIFCTPQKIGLAQSFVQLLQQAYRKGNLRQVIIDEVHCVVTWGKQFRKQYENLSQVKVMFPKTPILALTATVTQKIKQDIIAKLRIKNCFFFQSSFNRPNLMYEVRPKQKKSFIDDINIILGEHRNQSGIIYCLSRKDCEEMCAKLNIQGYKTAYYHANLHDKEKRQIQEGWMKNQIKIIIATIAFGMGINKPDVRFVVHYSLSKSLQGYYQESGRAGRDGQPATCILFYQRSDRAALQAMNLKNEYSDVASKMFSNRQLAQIVKYCEQKFICRRKFQLSYLGQKDFNSQLCNKTCDNCKKSRKYKEYECIQHAKQIVRFIQFVNDKSHYITKAQAISNIKGKNDKKIRTHDYRYMDRIHELFKFWTIDNLQQIFLELLSQQILKEIVITTKVPKIGNISNIYLQCNIPISHKFLQKVQTLPIRRQWRQVRNHSSYNQNLSKANDHKKNLDQFFQCFNDQQQNGFVIENQQNMNLNKTTSNLSDQQYSDINFQSYQFQPQQKIPSFEHKYEQKNTNYKIQQQKRSSIFGNKFETNTKNNFKKQYPSNNQIQQKQVLNKKFDYKQKQEQDKLTEQSIKRRNDIMNYLEDLFADTDQPDKQYQI